MSARDELAKHLADLWPVSTGDLREADAILSALSAMPLASRAALARALVPGWAVVPREPTQKMREAAFGPIMNGGRGGPITSDFIRQEAALGVYRKMLAAEEPPHGP